MQGVQVAIEDEAAKLRRVAASCAYAALALAGSIESNGSSAETSAEETLQVLSSLLYRYKSTNTEAASLQQESEASLDKLDALWHMLTYADVC